MRIKLSNKKEFFSKFLKETNLTKKELSKQLKVSYWTLRNWVRYRTLPKDYFMKILELYPITRAYAKYTELPDNWGATKGGKNSFKNKSQAEISFLLKKMWAATAEKNKIKIPPITGEFCELYGIILGDGCLSRFRVKGNKIRSGLFITGGSRYDFDYYKNNLTPLFEKLFGLTPKIYKIKSCNGIKIDVRNRNLVNHFLKFGFPIGKKKEIKIPHAIIDSGIYNVNRVIRGLFDTDGSFFARKDEDYKYPYIEITTTSNILRKQLKGLLKSQGFPAYFHAENVVVRGSKNTKIWFEIIGSSHPITLERYKQWEITGKLLPKGPVDQW